MLERLAKKMETVTKEGKTLSDVSQARKLIREAFPITEHGNAKRAVWAAYRKMKLKTERRARSIWNGEARLIKAEEMRAIENAAIEQARRDYIQAKNRVEALKQHIASEHAHFHGGSSGQSD